MQEGDRPIELGLSGFDARNREVDGAELFGGELMVVMFVRTSERGRQENRRTQTANPAHRASVACPTGSRDIQNRCKYGRSRVEKLDGNRPRVPGKMKGRPEGRPKRGSRY